MKTYIKFIINSYLKSFLNIFLIMLSLVFILNILKEIEFLVATKLLHLSNIFIADEHSNNNI